MDIGAFVQQYFTDPINQYSGYNIVNTLAYGAVLLVAAFLVIFPLLDRRGIRFNARFMLALFPYILFGTALRIVEDMHIIQRSASPLEAGYYFISPGIWWLIGLSTIAALLISRALAKKTSVDFHVIFAAIGCCLALPFLAFDIMHFVAWFHLFAIIALTLGITAAAYLITEKVKHGLLSRDLLNTLAVGSQALDGSATFVATQMLRCGEQHVLSSAILNLNGFAFIIIKVLLAIVIVHYIDREVKNENLRGFAKVFVVILGSATGLRDLLTVGVGTCL